MRAKTSWGIESRVILVPLRQSFEVKCEIHFQNHTTNSASSKPRAEQSASVRVAQIDNLRNRRKLTTCATRNHVCNRLKKRSFGFSRKCVGFLNLRVSTQSRKQISPIVRMKRLSLFRRGCGRI